MKQTHKIFLAIAMTLALAFGAFNASATEQEPEQEDVASFDCFLTVDETETIPAMTFEYTIEGQNVDDEDIKDAAFSVFKGPDGASIESVAFDGNETTATSVASGDSFSLDLGKKYAKKTVKVDFSDVSFTQAGIYGYAITETVTVNNAPYDADDVTVTNGDSAIVFTVSQDTQGATTRRTRYMDVLCHK